MGKTLYAATIMDYNKQNEKNKRFLDPQEHIWRKYWDSNLGGWEMQAHLLTAEELRL